MGRADDQWAFLVLRFENCATIITIDSAGFSPRERSRRLKPAAQIVVSLCNGASRRYGVFRQAEHHTLVADTSHRMRRRRTKTNGIERWVIFREPMKKKPRSRIENAASRRGRDSNPRDRCKPV